MLNSKIDGTYCISQVVSDSKKKTVWITSARIQKAAVGSQVPNGSNTTPQLQTSETPLVSSPASNNTISQDNNIVKNSIRKNAEYNTQDDTSSVGKATFPSRGRLVEQTEYGYELRGLPDAAYEDDLPWDDVKFSVETISGEKGNYGEGVYLDTDIFDGIKPRKWNKVLAKFVYDNLAGKTITVFDENGDTEEISFAKANERTQKNGAKKSHKVIDKLARAKGNINSLAIIHIDELLKKSREFDESDENSHQWLDQNGWIIKKLICWIKKVEFMKHY